MQEIGFQQSNTFSISQLTILVVFICIIFFIANILHRKKDFFKAYLPNIKAKTRYVIEVQKVDTRSLLYCISNETHTFLVFRTPDGVVLLDKAVKDVEK